MAIKRDISTSFNPATIQVNRGQGSRQLATALGEQGSTISAGVNKFVDERLTALETSEKKKGKKLAKQAEIVYEDKTFTDADGVTRTHKVATKYKTPENLLSTSWAASAFEEEVADTYLNAVTNSAKEILDAEQLIAKQNARYDTTVGEHLAVFDKAIQPSIDALLSTVPKEFQNIMQSDLNTLVRQTRTKLANSHLTGMKSYQSALTQSNNIAFDDQASTLYINDRETFQQRLTTVTQRNQNSAQKGDRQAQLWLATELPVYQTMLKSGEKLSRFLNYDMSNPSSLRRTQENINAIRLGLNMQGSSISLLNDKGERETGLTAKDFGFEGLDDFGIGKLDKLLKQQSTLLSTLYTEGKVTQGNMEIIRESFKSGVVTDMTKKEREKLANGFSNLDGEEVAFAVNHYNLQPGVKQINIQSLNDDVNAKALFDEFVVNNYGVFSSDIQTRLLNQTSTLVQTGNINPKTLVELATSREFKLLQNSVSQRLDGRVSINQSMDALGISKEVQDEIELLNHFQEITPDINIAVEQYLNNKKARETNGFVKTSEQIQNDSKKANEMSVDEKVEDVLGQYSDVWGMADVGVGIKLINNVKAEVKRKLRMGLPIGNLENIAIQTMETMLNPTTGKFGESKMQLPYTLVMDSGAGDFEPGVSKTLVKFPVDEYFRKTKAQEDNERFFNINMGVGNTVDPNNDVYYMVQDRISNSTRMYQTKNPQFEFEEDLILNKNVFFRLENEHAITDRNQAVYKLVFVPNNATNYTTRPVIDDNGKEIIYSARMLQDMVDEANDKKYIRYFGDRLQLKSNRKDFKPGTKGLPNE